MPKEYALFCGDYYYPNGGLDDLFGCYESLELAQQALPIGSNPDWAHIVYLPTMIEMINWSREDGNWTVRADSTPRR